MGEPVRGSNTYATAEKETTDADLTFSTAYNCNIAPRELGVCSGPVTTRSNRSEPAIGIVSGLVERPHIDGDPIFDVVNTRGKVMSSSPNGNMPVTSTLTGSCEGRQGKGNLTDGLRLNEAPRVQSGTGGPVRFDTFPVN